MNQNAVGSQDYKTEIQERQVAHKIRVTDLISGKFVKQEGMLPSYVVHKCRKISRANIIGTIVSKEANEIFESVVVDDGSASIPVRSFGKKGEFEGLAIGDIVLLIGKIREYGGERYVIKEVIKNLNDKKWVELRKLELKLSDLKLKEAPEETADEETIEEEIETPSKKVFDIIRKIDSGSGADFDEVIKTSGMENCDRIIEDLLKTGYVFEIRPGKLKVLE